MENPLSKLLQKPEPPVISINDEQKEALQRLVRLPEWQNVLIPLLEVFVSRMINTTALSKKGMKAEEWGKQMWLRDEAGRQVKDLLVQLKLLEKQPKEEKKKSYF